MKKLIFLIALLLTFQMGWAQKEQGLGHVVILGDSETWIGGDKCNGERGWSTWFAKETKPASCRSYARSGATWTCTENTKETIEEYSEKLSDNNVIYNQMQRLNMACLLGEQPVPDVIFIAAGTNDVWFSKKRPRLYDAKQLAEYNATVAPSRLQTLTDAFLCITRILSERYPKARIVVLTPFQCIRVSDAEIGRIGDLMEQLAQTATKDNIPVDIIRMDKLSPVKSRKERVALCYTYDGVHTSKAGAMKHGNIVATELKHILATDK